MLQPVRGFGLPASFDALLPKLASGWAGAYRIEGTKAALVISVGRTVDTDLPALWIEGLAGEIGHRPKANLRLMGEVFAQCETIARSLGCAELRIEANTRTSWKTALLPRFGFVPVRVGDRHIMRRLVTDG